MNLPAEAKRIGLHLVLAAVTLLSLFALAWILLDSVIMPKIAHAGWEVVTVPDITGMDSEAAARTLVDAGLEPLIDPERKSAGRMGPDLVALQRPAAKDSVKRGHVVRIWLSAGATTVPVPDLTGQDTTEASTHIQEAGLQISSTEWTASSRAPAGTVLRSEPSAGTLLVRGSGLKLVVSSGTDPDSVSTGIDTTKSGNGPKVF